MTSAGNPNANIIPETTLYDAVNHQVVAWEADESTVTTDTSVTPNITYAKAKISGTFSSSPPSDLSGTGTISAAQPTINTPVALATVVLALGSGQSTWKAMLSNGGGGFTGATTLVADKSPDGGTTWFSSSFKVNGASPNTPASTVVGPGPLELTGNAAGVSHVRIRCSVLNSTETIVVTLRAGAGIGDVGLLSSIPAGSNLIGYVEDIEQSGYTTLTSPPTQTNAGTETVLTFSSQVNRVEIYNGSTANLNYAFDATCTAGSLVLPPGYQLDKAKKVTAVHILTASATNVNGSTSGNIIVLGSL